MPQNTNILLLEDDVELMKFLDSILVHRGFKNIFKADTIPDAFKMYDSEELHGMFIDINLADGHGLEFAKQIRSKDKNIKLILMSADVSTDTVGDFRQVIDGFLLKPLEASQLIKIVELLFK